MEIYLLKVNILLALFYGFYRLLFVRDTFFVWHRVVLMLSVCVALSIPLADIGWWMSSHPQTANLSEVYREVVLPTVDVTVEGNRFPWLHVFTLLYIIGVVAFALRMVWQILTIVRMRLGLKRVVIDGCEVSVMNDDACPFSFFGWVFVNPDAQSPEQLREILVHEQAHVRQCHSLDIMAMELLSIVCWWNPFVWLMRREVRLNMEYLADERVIEGGNECKTYQYHLLSLAYVKNVATVSNNFNVLPLKLRIKMMNKRRTNKWLRAKYLLLAPMVAAALVACNLDSSPKSSTGEKDSLALPEVSVVSYGAENVEKVDTGMAIGDPAKAYFEVVEQMPQYPGGDVEMMKFLSSQVKYPKEATEKGISGRVVVSFIVMSDGTIADAKVVRSVHPLLDAEALRVVNLMPKWKPGMQDGKAVNVKYNIPVSFRLQ